MRRTSPAPPFVASRAGLAAAAALAASGCADLRNVARIEPEGVNVESPAAGVVAAAEARTYAFPTFRDVPAKVADVRPNAAYAQTVSGLVADRSALERWRGENPEIISGTEDYAAAQRAGARSGPGADPAPQADQTQRTTDWARRQREAVKPPPPKPAS